MSISMEGMLKGNWSPLILACLNDDYETINKLVEDQNVDINFKSTDGKTALHFAFLKCDLKMIDMLMKRNDLNMSIEDNNGNTPFENVCISSLMTNLHLMVEIPGIIITKKCYEHVMKIEGLMFAFHAIESNNEYFSQANGILNLMSSYNENLSSKEDIDFVISLCNVNFFNEKTTIHIKRFFSDPFYYRIVLRRLLGKTKIDSAKIYAIIQLFFNGYFRLINDIDDKNVYKRFIMINLKLPSELIMLLCNMVYRNKEQFIEEKLVIEQTKKLLY